MPALVWLGRATRRATTEPTLELRNRSGRTLHHVELNTVHPDYVPNASSSRLEDGDSLLLWAPSDYGPDKAELEASVEGAPLEQACLLPAWSGRRIVVQVEPDLRLSLAEDAGTDAR